MGLRAWLANITRAVDTEYDRRIRRASNVVAYGAGHGHGHGPVEAHGEDAVNEDAANSHLEQEDEGVEVVNVPRGTQVRPQVPPVPAPVEQKH